MRSSVQSISTLRSSIFQSAVGETVPVVVTDHHHVVDRALRARVEMIGLAVDLAGRGVAVDVVERVAEEVVRAVVALDEGR